MYGGSGIFPTLCKIDNKSPSHNILTTHLPSSGSGMIISTESSSLIFKTVPVRTLFDGRINTSQVLFSRCFSKNTSILAPVSLNP